MPPDPAVQSPRDIGASDRGRHEKADAQPTRSVPHTIQAEQQQVGDQNAEGRRRDRFDHFDRPYPATILVQLGLKRIRQHVDVPTTISAVEAHGS